MEEDWAASANAPPFSLYKDTTPEEEASKDGFVDILVYNRWSKSERKVYQKLKTEHIAAKIAKSKIKTMDELADAIESLNLIRKGVEDDGEEKLKANQSLMKEVDDLIIEVQKIQLKSHE